MGKEQSEQRVMDKMAIGLSQQPELLREAVEEMMLTADSEAARALWFSVFIYIEGQLEAGE